MMGQPQEILTAMNYDLGPDYSLRSFNFKLYQAAQMQVRDHHRWHPQASSFKRTVTIRAAGDEKATATAICQEATGGRLVMREGKALQTLHPHLHQQVELAVV